MVEDGVRVLKVCDAVLGVISIAFAIFGTFSALAGRATVTSAALLWSFPIFNLALGRLGRQWATVTRETVRVLGALPLIMLLYATKHGDFEHFIFPALAVVVGHGVLWGCLTSRPVVGRLLAFIFGGSVVVAGSLAVGNVDWLAIRHAASVTMTGLIVSVVSAQLGKSLREARARRDEAESHKRRLESTVQQLASTQQRLDAVLRCAPGFILAVDRVGKVEFSNRETMPFGTAEVVAVNLLDQASPELRERFAERIDTVFQTGEQQTLEFRDVSKDGTERWFAATFGPQQREEQIGGVVVISQEVTDLKRSQAAVVATQRMAAVGTLAAGIAHEINTPIQFIGDTTTFLRGAMTDLLDVVAKLQVVEELALAGPATPELETALVRSAEAQGDADLAYVRENAPMAFETCLDGLQRVATIVRSMKEFAHPSQEEMGSVDLNHAIENTLTIARNEYKFVADVRTTFADLPPITCHIGDLNQAVLNLIVNAAHAISDVVKDTMQRGTITVVTRLDGDHAVISIGDTGTGIPEAVRARIFEPFFTTKEVGKGTGQGLALVWATVIDRHGGDVSFDTNIGEGTTFHIRIPVAGKRRVAPRARTLEVASVS
jgi:PAS domain S-box-containing protein